MKNVRPGASVHGCVLLGVFPFEFCSILERTPDIHFLQSYLCEPGNIESVYPTIFGLGCQRNKEDKMECSAKEELFQSSHASLQEKQMSPL